MGVLKDYKESNPSPVKSGSSSVQTEHLPVKVVSYDGDSVNGVRLDTNENVTVKLTEMEPNPNSKYQRVEVKDFSNPSHKRHVVPSQGVLLFESSKKVDDIYYSRWASCISRNPEESQIHILNCSLIFGKTNTEEEWIQIRLIFPEKKQQVSNLEELTASLTKLLHPNGVGSNPVAYIVIDDGETKEEIMVSSKRVEREDGLGKCAASGQASTENFLNSDDSKIIKDLITNEALEITVTPGRILYPGGSTKEKLIDLHATAKKILKESFFLEKEEEQSGSFNEAGYVKCSIATRKHNDGSQYVTHIKPIESFPKAKSVKDF